MRAVIIEMMMMIALLVIKSVIKVSDWLIGKKTRIINAG